MTGLRRSKPADRSAPRPDAPATNAVTPNHGTARDRSPIGFGWTALCVALVPGLVLFVPFGLERAPTVIPANSADYDTQSPAPETWVLSSTVAKASPNADDAEPEPDHDNARDPSGGSEPLIIRVPVGSPNIQPGRGPRPTTQQTATSGTARLPSPTSPGKGWPCPEASPTGVGPLISEKAGGDLGSASGTSDDTDEAGDTIGAGASCPR
ncbi:hypothetical protein [Dietzia sp. ANT_WB102]|uniref:hypothetical protein n=1 Tax=Dietzia sp. ANT_WB102 TaxID=2597345 RepID=UPI0011EEDF70|nr:hypothetical protein [Dietzia sp. ANT_WB102]KAA0918960.1 hypothetical protein FQ137_06600 [Dietzia sp. ANT_WB102]